jgi:hypothetical protein
MTNDRIVDWQTLMPKSALLTGTSKSKTKATPPRSATPAASADCSSPPKKTS